MWLGFYSSSVCRTREDQEGVGQKPESRHQHVHRLTHRRYSIPHRRCLQLLVRRRFPEIAQVPRRLLLRVITLSIPTALTQARLVTLTSSVEKLLCAWPFFSSPLTFESFLAVGPVCLIFSTAPSHIRPSRCDGVDVLVQHRPPRRQRRLRATGGHPFLLQGEGLCAAHLHGGSHHRLGGSGGYWGGGPLQPG